MNIDKKRKMKKRKAQANIIVIVLLVILVLASITVAWNIVRGVIIKSSEEVYIEQLTIDLEIESVYIAEDNETAYVSVNRAVGEGEMTALEFIFEGSTYNYRYPMTVGIPEELGTKVYNITAAGIKAQNPDFTNFSTIRSISISFEIAASGKVIKSPVKDKFDEGIRLNINLPNQWGAEKAPVYEGSGYEGNCSGGDTSCGIFPDCDNCNSLDSCAGAILTDYSCTSNEVGCEVSGTDDCSDCSCTCEDYGQADEASFCSDGKDNDCDGDTDGADSDCSSCAGTDDDCGVFPTCKVIVVVLVEIMDKQMKQAFVLMVRIMIVMVIQMVLIVIV